MGARTYNVQPRLKGLVLRIVRTPKGMHSTAPPPAGRRYSPSGWLHFGREEMKLFFLDKKFRETAVYNFFVKDEQQRQQRWPHPLRGDQHLRAIEILLDTYGM